MSRRVRSSPFPVLVIGALAPVAVLAQQAPDDTLDEVVIRSGLRSTTLAELPASATLLDSRTLADAGVQHFGDVLGLVPNLNFAGGTARPRYLQLRGIGELEQYEGAPNPSVGFLIDEVDFSGIGAPALLFDTERIEVLRGPQGTTYGANALAGLVSLTTHDPVDRFEALGAVEGGSYGLRSGGFVVNDTLGDDAAFRLVAHRFKADGFRRNAFLGRRDTNGFDETLLRGKLRWRIGEDLTADVMAMVADLDDGYDAWAIDNSRVTQSDEPGRDAQRSRAMSLRLAYDGLPAATLRSITAVAQSDMDYSFDGDWGNDAFWGDNGPYQFFERIGRERRSVSQELRLVSKDAAARLRWVGGLYALRIDEDYGLLDTYNGELYREISSDYRATNVAAYGQLDWSVAPRLTLSSGLRVERRSADYADSNGLRVAPDDTMLGGHLTVTFREAEGRDWYASLTRGYKAGGLNTGSDVPDSLRLYDPEFLWSVESGLKTRSADGRFDTQTSLFYMRRADQQVSSSVQTDPSDPLTFLLLTDNAARGENFGLEAQAGYRPVPALRLAATLGVLRARFADYQVEGRVLDGRDQPHAPRYQASLSADLRLPSGFFARADATAMDAFYFSASHDERSGAYQLVNLRVGYEARDWMLSAWARNVFDQRYAVRGFFFGNEPPDFTPKRYVLNGDPRQAGVSLTYRF
jgi:iron complex outermembrane recepter protein